MIERTQSEKIEPVREILYGLPSIRKGGRENRVDVRKITAIIVVGSSGSGKSTLQRSVLQASRLDPDLVDLVSVPQRVVTRAKRSDDGDEITYASPEEFESLVERGELGLFGTKIMEKGREERYGYTKPDRNTLPIFFANNGVVKNPELVQPPNLLDSSLLVAIFAPDEERKRRVIRRSPDLLQESQEFAFRFSEEESSLNLLDKVDFVIDNYGTQETRSSLDFVEFLKRIVRQKQIYL